MTWKDKLEIGLKDDAPFRKDNLPEFQQSPASPDRKPGDPERSPEQPGAGAPAGRQNGARQNRPRDWRGAGDTTNIG